MRTTSFSFGSLLSLFILAEIKLTYLVNTFLAQNFNINYIKYPI